jgi:hypothetical protein
MNRTMTACISAVCRICRAHGARLGAWGLAFFALKGLGWLLLPLITLYFT